MLRLGTNFVAIAVSAVALAAVVDAFRASDDPESSPGGGASAGTAAELRAAGVSGVLVYRDAACRVHAVTLPDLERHAPSRARRCSFAGAAPGLAFGPRVVDVGGVVSARCRGGAVHVRVGSFAARTRGCAPAWRPNGTLTAVRGGEVVKLHPSPAERRLVVRVVLSQRDLARAFRSPGAAVRSLLWLDGETMASVVRVPDEGDVLALLRGGRLVGRPLGPFARLSGLRASPGGTFVAARSEERGVVVVNRRGQAVRVAQRGAAPRAVTWSPDERWIAVATRNAVTFLRTRGPALAPLQRQLRIPLRASDLAWR